MSYFSERSSALEPPTAVPEPSPQMYLKAEKCRYQPVAGGACQQRCDRQSNGQGRPRQRGTVDRGDNSVEGKACQCELLPLIISL